MSSRPWYLGRSRALTRDEAARPRPLPPHHLVTHGVCVGMTGSGKTGFCVVMLEEALRSGVPVLTIDVKGDLANLLLTFPSLAPAEFAPWIDPDAARRAQTTVDALAASTAEKIQRSLAQWSLGAADVAALRESTAFRVITPGTTAAEPLHVLSSLESPGALWELDEEAARESLSATISLLLRMIDRDADSARSRAHVLLSLLAEKRLRAGGGAPLESLVADLQRPPLARVGALSLDEFLPENERASLAQDLNTLIASPTFASWRQGAALDVGQWLAPRPDGRTPAVIVSIAHLDDGERMLVLSLILEQVLAWVRSLSGTSDLRALVLLDEVFGFLPPHPAAPPSKRPLLALMKQARAFGVGVVLATQNPMDLDYKALSNAGLWCVGRLQTDADRERVVEGLTGALSSADALSPEVLSNALKSLAPRTFFLRDVHDPEGAQLLETRTTLSWLRGPLTRQELRRLTRPVAPVATATAPVPSQARALTETATQAPPPAVPTIAATREMPAIGAPASEIPALPSGWSAWHETSAQTVAPTYAPWVAATIVAHVRDARLGVHVTRMIRAMAPLTPEGRIDTARGRVFDPSRCTTIPAAGARYAPLPEVLSRKNGPSGVERALREEVYRTLQVTVELHREYGLTAGPDESHEDFVRRCVQEAERRAQAEIAEIDARHAPKIQRQTEKLAAARAAVTAAATQSPVGSVLATASALVRGGKRALARLETQQDKQQSKREKAQAEVIKAEGDLRELHARRDAERTERARQASRAGEAIERKVLGARRDDIELQEIGVCWIP